MIYDPLSASIPLMVKYQTYQHKIRIILSFNSTNITNFCHFSGFPVINDPLYNHTVFGPNKGKGGIVGKTDSQLIQDLIAIHNAENWLGMDGDSELSMFNKDKDDESGESKTPSPTSEANANNTVNENTNKIAAGTLSVRSRSRIQSATKGTALDFDEKCLY